jgi:hypothetical protein
VRAIPFAIRYSLFAVFRHSPFAVFHSSPLAVFSIHHSLFAVSFRSPLAAGCSPSFPIRYSPFFAIRCFCPFAVSRFAQTIRPQLAGAFGVGGR